MSLHRMMMAAAAQGGAEPNPVLQFSDGFNSADAPLGASWDSSPDIKRFNFLAATTATNSSRIARVATATYAFGGNQSAKISVTGADLAYTIFSAALVRCDASGDNYYSGGYATSTGGFRIQKRLAGSTTTVDNTTEAMPARPFTMELVAFGDDITLFVDGVEKLTINDTDISTGQPGFLMFRGSGSNQGSLTMDDFEAYSQ